MKRLKVQAERAVLIALVILLILIPVTYFLGLSSQASHFPLYLIGILIIIHAFTTPHEWQDLISTPPQILTLILLFYMGITPLFSLNISQTGFHLIYAFLLLSFFRSMALGQIRYPWLTDAFLLVAVMSAVVSAAYAIYLFHSLDYQPLDEARLYSMGGLHNPVVSAISYGAIATICISYLTISKESWTRLVALAALAILAWALVLSGTRSVWIGLVGCLAALFFHAPGLNSQTKIRIVGTILVAACITAGLIWYTGYIEVLLKRGLSFRPEIWAGFLELIKDKPILGYGIQASSKIVITGYNFQHPHSIYIATLYYTGIVGLSLFLITFGHVLYRCFRNPKPGLQQYAVAGIAFGMTTLAFDGNRLLEKVDYVWFALWVPYGLALCSLSSGSPASSEKQPKSDQRLSPN